MQTYPFFTPKSLDDFIALKESVVLECKLALGANGQGQIPKDFWPSYSAMANTMGGVILLGVQEKNGVFSVKGLPNIAQIKTELFNNLNNPQKVSINLLNDSHVQELLINGQAILQVCIPQANRNQKPVYLNGQVLSATYRRLNDGDRRCDEETVKRMLAEQANDSRDTTIFSNYGLEDLNLQSLHAYRNIFASQKLSHPWIQLSDVNFLKQLGAYREDKNKQESGLTLAGVLMFGNWITISQCAPFYFVDYQEHSALPTPESPWIDRVVPDGTWSGNLFDFFNKTIHKLSADLKVPFVLKGISRVDDTPSKQALREALVNTLVHADYQDRASIRVIKSPYGFEFRNPGALRVGAAQALKGGESDCRNRIIQQIFLMINLGERAGSGLPRILHNWLTQGQTLELFDLFEPFDQSVLIMSWGNVNQTEPPSAVLRERSPLLFSPKGLLKMPVQNWLQSQKLPAIPIPETTKDGILRLVKQNPHITIVQMALLLAKDTRTIERTIARLRLQNLLQRVGPNQTGHWRIMHSTPR